MRMAQWQRGGRSNTASAYVVRGRSMLLSVSYQQISFIISNLRLWASLPVETQVCRSAGHVALLTPAVRSLKT